MSKQRVLLLENKLLYVIVAKSVLTKIALGLKFNLNQTIITQFKISLF